MGTGKEMGVESAANIELYRTHSIEKTSYGRQVAVGCAFHFEICRSVLPQSPFALGVFVCVLGGVVDEGV